jgi:hypothetical protein
MILGDRFSTFFVGLREGLGGKPEFVCTFFENYFYALGRCHSGNQIKDL